MNRFKYSLIVVAMGLVSATSVAETYKVIDLGGVENTRHSYATGVNNLGDVVGVSKEHFNFPIDLARLNMTVVEAALANVKTKSPGTYDDVLIEDIQNGVISANANAFLRLFLIDRASDITIQKVGDQSAFAHFSGTTAELNFFDYFDDTLQSKTRNTVDLVNAINDNGVMAATAGEAFYTAEYTPEPTEAVPEPATTSIWMKDALEGVGVISKGDSRVILSSPDNSYGGASYLTDISNSNYVVGYAAIGLTNTAQSSLDDACGALTDPVQVFNCAWSTRRTLSSNNSAMFTMRAFRWQLNDNLEVIEASDLGLAFTPKETDLRNHISVATGVNELGHVAGFSSGFKSQTAYENDDPTRLVATYFDGTEQKEFINQSTYFESKSLDINDDNIVVGYAQRYVSGLSTKQMFIYDGNTGTTTYPTGFFASSAAVARAVNNNNQVVGEAEVDSVFGNVRRKRGFIYDIDTDTITDLNTLISCTSPYTIAQARDINDDGVIVGSALLNVEKLDALGEVMKDESGNTIMEEVSRAVKLVPVSGGTVDNCEATDEPKYERKGAVFNGIGLLCLSFLIAIRRRKSRLAIKK